MIYSSCRWMFVLHKTLQELHRHVLKRKKQWKRNINWFHPGVKLSRNPEILILIWKDVIYTLSKARIFCAAATLKVSTHFVCSGCTSSTARQGCKWSLFKSMWNLGASRGLNYAGGALWSHFMFILVDSVVSGLCCNNVVLWSSGNVLSTSELHGLSSWRWSDNDWTLTFTWVFLTLILTTFSWKVT